MVSTQGHGRPKLRRRRRPAAFSPWRKVCHLDVVVGGQKRGFGMLATPRLAATLERVCVDRFLVAVVLVVVVVHMFVVGDVVLDRSSCSRVASSTVSSSSSSTSSSISSICLSPAGVEIRQRLSLPIVLAAVSAGRLKCRQFLFLLVLRRLLLFCILRCRCCLCRCRCRCWGRGCSRGRSGLAQQGAQHRQCYDKGHQQGQADAQLRPKQDPSQGVEKFRFGRVLKKCGFIKQQEPISCFYLQEVHA